MEDPRKIVGRTVRKHRLKLNMSQEVLAEKAGVHRTYIGQVERGETNISLASLVKVADALGVRVRQLVEAI